MPTAKWVPVVILLSALAVVAAAVLLVAWFVVGGGFALLYGAMALAVASMLLLWAARWIGSTTAPPLSRAPEPLEPSVPVAARHPHEPRQGDVPGVDEEVAEVELDLTGAFPIADYDHLWVTQIIPLLGELDADELAMVEARERGGRHRGGVLDALDAQRAARRRTGSTTVADRPAPTTEPEAWDDDASQRGFVDHDWEDETWRTGEWFADDEPATADEVEHGDGLPLAIDAVKVDAVEVDPGLEVEPEPEVVVSAATGAEDEMDAPVVEPTPEVHEPMPELVGSGPRVRTFLGRPSGPITLRHH